MFILGLETSCDETSVALLEHRGANELAIHANLIASQIEAHQIFGGVVPEIASRKHLEAVGPLLELLRERTGVAWRDLDLISVTRGPGLSGALLVGVSAGKALSYAARVPARGVNHVEGHLLSTFLQNPDLRLPMLALVVSGGHTDLILMRDFGDYERLGHTRDDAIGEAYDKVARALGLPMPGGPNLEKLAQKGDPNAFDFTITRLGEGFDFSYSGLKTAASQMAQKQSERNFADIAASFQKAAVAQVGRQVGRALEEYAPATFGLCGGVAANNTIRAALAAICEREDVAFVVPEPVLCTDNAAMIGAAGFFRARAAGFPSFRVEDLDFEARSVWPVAETR